MTDDQTPPDDPVQLAARMFLALSMLGCCGMLLLVCGWPCACC